VWFGSKPSSSKVSSGTKPYLARSFMESRFSGKFSNSRSSRYIETGLFVSSRSSRSVNKTGSSGGKLGEGGDCEGSRPRVLIERTREERTAFDTGRTRRRRRRRGRTSRRQTSRFFLSRAYRGNHLISNHTSQELDNRADYEKDK
jgi:hypothetical protein